MNLKSRDLALAFILVLGVLGAMMASPSSSNMALGATTCGVNGCVSTPPLSSTTSYSYSGTSVSTISSTSTTLSTSISSSTTSTTATTTSTSWSYTSTLSTTETTTSYSTSYTGTQTSSNTLWVTVSTTTTSSSTYTAMVTQKGTTGLPGCPVSYATNGTPLQPYADFLRGFRNNDIQNTTAGREFMLAFNTWYYGWAPSLSYSAATNPLVFKAVQMGVYPLIGILYASYYSYTLVAPISTEAAAITAGIVAASLLGVVFVAPIAFVTMRILKRHSRLVLSKQSVGPSVLWFTGSILMCLVGYATGSGQVLAIATSSIAVSVLTLGGLIGMRTLAYVQVPIVNYAGMALSFKRLARSLFL